MIVGKRPLLSSRKDNRRRAAVLASLFAFVATAAGAVDARADETNTDYCRKVTATAQGDAAMLFAPIVSGQLIRYPAGGVADKNGLQQGQGVQPRASMTLGLVDIYRGFGVMDVAHADCRRQERAATLEEVVALHADIGQTEALAKKLEVLRGKRPLVQEMLRNAEDRFAAHTTTLLEVHELRRQASLLDHKAAETEQELDLVKRRGLPALPVPLPQMIEEYEQRAGEYEAAVSHVRKLQPWNLNLTAGVTVQPVVDAFGVIELTYNVGGLFRNPAENRSVAARTEEIKHARYEMRHQVETLLEQLRIGARRSQEQVAMYDEELARIAKERASLDGLDAPNKTQVIAALTLEAIELEAERAYLATLSERQTSFGGKS